MLQDLLENAASVRKPWRNGYQLAEGLLDSMEDAGCNVLSGEHGSIISFCDDFGIEVIDLKLDANPIPDVALAGIGLKPVTVVNESRIYNGSKKSRRFAAARKLRHILHDQSRARKLAHISGPWANPAIERRANAFAAWILMPGRFLIDLFVEGEDVEDANSVRRVGERIRVTDTALIWHLYNLGFIQDPQRESLLSDPGHGKDPGYNDVCPRAGGPNSLHHSHAIPTPGWGRPCVAQPGRRTAHSLPYRRKWTAAKTIREPE